MKIIIYKIDTIFILLLLYHSHSTERTNTRLILEYIGNMFCKYMVTIYMQTYTI